MPSPRALEIAELHNLQSRFLETAVLSAATRESLIVATRVFSNSGFAIAPEAGNGRLEQSLFILTRHKVFIVCGLYRFNAFC